jgi:protein-tyrosine phosphatase/membrane-associated phospholipid phosphatase
MRTVTQMDNAQATPKEGRPWKLAMLWLAVLGPLFFLSYGYANHYASTLAHVGSYVYGWERELPFWDWTILPYMSIDLFYAISLFLCTSRAELRTHALRLLAATVTSVAFFLLFPLKFSFARPPTHGFNGWLFDVLTGFDQPYNQAPSLHVSLLMILWVCYSRHTRGIARWLLHAWFTLIAVSVLTTYQHHFIDIATGAGVGVLCLYLIPGAPFTLRLRPRGGQGRDIDDVGAGVGAGLGAGFGAGMRAGEIADGRGGRLARRYAQGAVVVLLLSVCALRAQWITTGLLLLWPAFAIGMVALAYAGQGTRVFQKEQGRMRGAARVALAPYWITAWISSRLLTWRIAPFVQVYPGVWIGRAPSRRDLRLGGFEAVVDLAAEFPARRAALARNYAQVSMLDLVAPSAGQLTGAVAAIQAAQARGHKTLVHCALGFSRSALSIAAWRMTLGDDCAAVFDRLRAARTIAIAPAYPAILQDWLAQHREGQP